MEVKIPLTIPTYISGLSSTHSLSAPHTVWDNKKVKWVVEPLSFGTVFQNGDKNYTHKAIRKPGRRKYISELYGEQRVPKWRNMVSKSGKMELSCVGVG